MGKFVILVLAGFFLIGGGYFVTHFMKNTNVYDSTYSPSYVSGKHLQPSEVAAVSETVVAPSTITQILSLDTVKHLLPQISWKGESPDSIFLLGKTYHGVSLTGTFRSQMSGVSDFGEKDSLLSAGWSLDNSLAAGGANGNAWAYTIDREGGRELLYFHYTNVTFTPPPDETKCPCTFEVQVFDSDSL